MRPVLGIELGPTRCALVLVEDGRDAGGEVRVVAHHVVKYMETGDLSGDLKRLRVSHRLPRRARVVLWPREGDPGVTPVDRSGTAGGFSPGLWHVRERLRPLVRAGFRITGAITPAQALAALVSLGGAPGAVGGLAVDERAGSLAIVGREGLIDSRVFAWKFPAPGADAPLLSRYAFAAQVLPQLRRAIDAARDTHAARVEKIVLCGPAPALRALASPMIEELDVEIETLDGSGGVVSDAEPDAAASAQLAAGAAVAAREVSVIPGMGSRAALTPARVVVGAAAAAAVILLVLLFWPAPQASRTRRATTGLEGTSEARPLPGQRSALRGEPALRPAWGEPRA